MKQLACEMCGSTDLIKQDGVFVCQSCGMKYSVEDAKKMIVEGTVDVQGTVKIDKSEELKDLYTLARRARKNGDHENAWKYYKQIVVNDSSSWEATFYSIYLQSKNCTISEIGYVASKIANSIGTVFELIKQHVTDSNEQKEVISEVLTNLMTTASDLFTVYVKYYTGIDATVRHNFIESCANNCFPCAQIYYMTGYKLLTIFGDIYQEFAIDFLESGITHHSLLLKQNIVTDDLGLIKKANETIKKYDPDRCVEEPTINNTQSGCYIATAVYGSYDCPQVWILRRYRDDTLAETWYGRAFIKTYYAISPTLVKWFGHTEWFKNVWKGKLDRMVANLQANGVESTPYEDKEW